MTYPSSTVVGCVPAHGGHPSSTVVGFLPAPEHVSLPHGSGLCPHIRARIPPAQLWAFSRYPSTYPSSTVVGSVSAPEHVSLQHNCGLSPGTRARIPPAWLWALSSHMAGIPPAQLWAFSRHPSTYPSSTVIGSLPAPEHVSLQHSCGLCPRTLARIPPVLVVGGHGRLIYNSSQLAAPVDS